MKNYIYDSQYSNFYNGLEITDYSNKNYPSIKIVEDGIILPAKSDGIHPWGAGGVLDANHKFVEESAIDITYGGEYAYNQNELVYYDEEVICISIIPKQWGHVIIDVLSKLWIVQRVDKKIRIAFCGLDWESGLTGNYLQIMELAGIERDRLLFIDKPSAFSKIILPDRTLGFGIDYHPVYKDIIGAIVHNATEIANKRRLRPIEKIYATRLFVETAQRREVGEKELAQFFEVNGYTVLQPEKLDAAEQIYYYSHCGYYACISGTLSHNIVFAGNNVKFTILNRTVIPNPPQMRINQMMAINCTYVDVFSKRKVKSKNGYLANDDNILLFELNNNVIQYAKDNNMTVPEKGKFQTLSVKIKNNIRYIILKLRRVLSHLKHKLLISI